MSDLQREHVVAWRLTLACSALNSAMHNLELLEEVDPDLDPLLLPAVRSLFAKLAARLGQ